MKTQLKILEAIELHNERKRAKNKQAGRDEKDGFLNQISVGMYLYPLEEYQKSKGKKYEFEKYRESVRVSTSNLIRGGMNKINIEWVQVLCDALGVDANFLFGFPSKFDKEFNKLCN
jgi:hypothetical protein